MDSKLLESAWRQVDCAATGLDLTGVVRRVHSEAARNERAPRRKSTPPRQQAGADFVQALAHGLRLLECWQGQDAWLANSELSTRSGLTRPSVSRLTCVLVELGYLMREGRRGRFRLGAATLGLGFGSAFATVPPAAAKDQLARLANELDVYAALSVRRLDKVQILENVVSPLHPDAVVMEVGRLLPICRCASGLAAMSALPEPEASPLIEQLRAHYADRWNPLARNLDRTRQELVHKGFCTSVAVLSKDVGAVAVPILAAGSNDIFVLACGMAAKDFYPERVEREIAPRLLQVAGELAQSLALF